MWSNTFNVLSMIAMQKPCLKSIFWLKNHAYDNFEKMP